MSRLYVSFSVLFVAAFAACACHSPSGKIPVTPPPVVEPPSPNPTDSPCESELSHVGPGAMDWESRITGLAGYSLGPTSGSVVRIDVNSDGCLDFVFGAAGDTFRRVSVGGREASVPTGLGYAIDWVSGDLLWSARAVGELFALPVELQRANGERSVVFAGRLAALISVDSSTGNENWAFDPAQGTVWGYPLNFFNPIVIDDQDGDGTEDLFVAYGGYDLAEPGAPRPASYFGLISGETGAWITRRRTPDLAETYMSPYLRNAGGTVRSQWKFLVGTGGETLGGGLWEISLADIYGEDNGESYGRLLVEGGDEKGVIAPPTVGEFREAGQFDTLAPMFDGRVVLLDATSDTPVWQVEFPGEELMSVASPLQLSDGEWGVAIYGLVGAYPEYELANLRILRASDGEVVTLIPHEARLAGSPVTAKISSSVCDDILWGTTDFSASKLHHWKCSDGTIIEESFDFATLATPVLIPRASGGIDLGWLGTTRQVEEVPSHDWEVIEEDPVFRFEFFTLWLTDSPDSSITWGAYMGDGSGVFLRP